MAVGQSRYGHRHGLCQLCQILLFNGNDELNIEESCDFSHNGSVAEFLHVLKLYNPRLVRFIEKTCRSRGLRLDPYMRLIEYPNESLDERLFQLHSMPPSRVIFYLILYHWWPSDWTCYIRRTMVHGPPDGSSKSCIPFFLSCIQFCDRDSMLCTSVSLYDTYNYHGAIEECRFEIQSQGRHGSIFSSESQFILILEITRPCICSTKATSGATSVCEAVSIAKACMFMIYKHCVLNISNHITEFFWCHCTSRS